MYAIFQTSPIHDYRDAIVGSRTSALPMTYHTLGCAKAIASRMNGIECETGGDCSYEVRSTEGLPILEITPQMWGLSSEEDIPF
jgi:hypothetical protein